MSTVVIFPAYVAVFLAAIDRSRMRGQVLELFWFSGALQIIFARQQMPRSTRELALDHAGIVERTRVPSQSDIEPFLDQIDIAVGHMLDDVDLRKLDKKACQQPTHRRRHRSRPRVSASTSLGQSSRACFHVRLESRLSNCCNVGSCDANVERICERSDLRG